MPHSQFLFMPTFTTTVNNHTFDIQTSIWSGKETIRYDGRVVSEKRSFLFVTPHSFTVEESGQPVVYEVNVITGMTSHGYLIRRNGIIQAHQP